MLRLRTIYAVEYSNQCRLDSRLYSYVNEKKNLFVPDVLYRARNEVNT